MWSVGFCFGDRGFMTASPEIYAILCLCKERLCQESTLRGLRREVRFIMSPPGKRRHNELNAAPPPETPRRTGKPGESNNRDVVHSGESFCIRGKSRLFGEPRGTNSPRPCFAALEGKPKKAMTQSENLCHQSKPRPPTPQKPQKGHTP